MNAFPYSLKVKFLFLSCALCLLTTWHVQAQNLNGVKIQVAAEALTFLKFNGDIKRFEFGDRDDYTAQVVGDDQLRIKTLNNNPTPTNLIVTEGNRTHMFVIQVMTKIDINNFKAYYDYSDLKALKKLAAASNAQAGVAVVEEPVDPKAEKQAEKERKEKEEKELAARKEKEKKEAQIRKEAAAKAKEDDEAIAKAKAEEEREKKVLKEKNDALAKEKERQRQEQLLATKNNEDERKQQQAEKAKRDKEAAAAKQREDQLAKEKQKEESAAKQREANEEKQRLADEKAADAREAQRQKNIAAAKEKDRQAAIAKAETQRKEEEQKKLSLEKARKEQKAKDDAIAQEKTRQREAEQQKAMAEEKERQRQEDIARKKEEAAEKDRQAREEKARQQVIALEKEKARQEEKARQAEEAKLLAEKRAQERQDALITNPYWKTVNHKKYPNVNFAELPVGQKVTGEYFLKRDSLTNSEAAYKTIEESPRIKLSEEKDNVTIKLDAISFSGVNSFIRLTVKNGRDKDFLMGKTIVTWWKKGGSALYLYPVYVTDFPVIGAGKEMSVVVGCRGVNATDADDFSIAISDRLDPSVKIELPFTGKVYNKEMKRGVTKEGQ